MKVELNKEDLRYLVKGITPDYSVFDNALVKRCGNFTGGFVDKWDWDHHELSRLSEQELMYLYTTCKDSWDTTKYDYHK